MEFSTSIQEESSFFEEDYETLSEESKIRKITLAEYLHLDGNDEKKLKEETNCCKKFKIGLKMISVG